MQAVCPEAHEGTHAFALQTCPDGQAVPHAPQLASSVAVSEHSPPHITWPDGQSGTHFPALQYWPMAQAFAHAPQFAGSFCVSVHVDPHSWNGAGHPSIASGPASPCGGIASGPASPPEPPPVPVPVPPPVPVPVPPPVPVPVPPPVPVPVPPPVPVPVPPPVLLAEPPPVPPPESAPASVTGGFPPELQAAVATTTAITPHPLTLPSPIDSSSGGRRRGARYL